MMRSMFSGVSGLQAHQTRMDVIGNNIANVNTIGFKSGRVTFQEVFNETLKGASASDATTGKGGTNPMQIGLGIGIGSVDTITTRGSDERTNSPTDLSIEGDGYFICKGGNGGTTEFTRAGNFGIDKLGNLVTGDGMNVQGWEKYSTASDGSVTFDTEAALGPINLYSDSTNGNKKMIAAKATTSAVFAGNLNANFAATGTTTSAYLRFTMPMSVYDSLGNSYKVNVDFYKTSVSGTGSAAVTQWTWRIPSTGSGFSSSAASGVISFNSKGQALASGTSLKPSIVLDTAPSVGSAPIDIKLDFSKITQYSADSSAKPTNIDGYSTGSLITFSIGQDGVITGIYGNGQQQPLGMLGVATFENPAGLQKVGSNMFLPTTNSGDFKKAVKPGTEGSGSLSPGTLEMSNVDLSEQFTNMIITERGFQANSKIISTSDEMLQELVNLKR